MLLPNPQSKTVENLPRELKSLQNTSAPEISSILDPSVYTRIESISVYLFLIHSSLLHVLKRTLKPNFDLFCLSYTSRDHKILIPQAVVRASPSIYKGSGVNLKAVMFCTGRKGAASHTMISHPTLALFPATN